MNANLERYFRDYASLYNQALAGAPDYDAIMARFTPCFVAAGPAGVQCGENGPQFRETLERAFAFYKTIGAQRMSIERVEATGIEPSHALAKVHYRADHLNRANDPVSIAFAVTYLLQIAGGEIRIFAFIAGDEMEAYRKAGLVD